MNSQGKHQKQWIQNKLQVDGFFKQKCLRMKWAAMTSSSGRVQRLLRVYLAILTEYPTHLYTIRPQLMLSSLNQFPSLTTWQNMAVFQLKCSRLSEIFPDTTLLSKPSHPQNSSFLHPQSCSTSCVLLLQYLPTLTGGNRR